MARLAFERSVGTTGTLVQPAVSPAVGGSPSVRFDAAVAKKRPLAEVKWSWSCRSLPAGEDWKCLDGAGSPRVGDVVVVRVENVGNHTRIMTADERRLRLYNGDVLVGVMGNRYASDAFEGEVRDTERLHVLTGAGMIGTVCSRHRGVSAPTLLSFKGYLCEPDGRRVNLKARHFRPLERRSNPPNVILVVGTAMNAGKTTTAAKLVKGLLGSGLRVAAVKLTGSVSPRDRHEFCATGAQLVRDFSDYGFPSTYLSSKEELLWLFDSMLADAARIEPHALVVEIADGLLQRETKMLLEDADLRERIGGVVLAASDSAGALFGISVLELYGHNLLCLSGVVTNSPLSVREVKTMSSVPIAPSTDGGEQLAGTILQQLSGE